MKLNYKAFMRFLNSVTQKRVILVLFLGVLFLPSLGCKPSSGVQPELRREMLDAYAASRGLFRYVWNPEQFGDKKNQRTIAALLERLGQDFHRVGDLEVAQSRDPGFQVTLLTNQQILSDSQKAIQEGNTAYAAWRLRGLAAQCVACHTRYDARIDFIGDAPIAESPSAQARLAAAEFLLASRQFDKASEELFKIAQDYAGIPEVSFEGIEALKLWLLVEVRAKNRPQYAAKLLAELLQNAKFSPDHGSILHAWIQQLEQLWAEKKSRLRSPDPIELANELLRPVAAGDSVMQDEKNLVRTLKATALLHQVLETELTVDMRRQATFLLALAYQHVPIPSMEVFRQLYLEQCIREFPGTEEAKKSYILLETYLEEQSSGSGGLHYDDSDLARLGELRRIAFGAGRNVLRETLLNPGSDAQR